MKIEYIIENNTNNNFTHSSSSKRFFVYYALIIIIGASLLIAPFSLNTYDRLDGKPWTLIDAIFTASSAFSDTGLVSSPTAHQFTWIGQLVILLLILVGGIGFLTVKVLLMSFIGRRIGIKDRLLLSSERGSAKLGATQALVKTAIIVIFVFILFGTLTLGLYFYFVPIEETNNYGNFGLSLWQGLFHSTSAINNAGFDITGNSSLSPYFDHYFVQMVIMILFIVGGMGFPVIHDVRLWFKDIRNGKRTKFRWSLFTKISFVTYVIVSLSGLTLTFIIEMNSNSPFSFWSNADYSTIEKIWALIFNTFSTRNAGFATMDLGQLSDGTLLVYSIMMFIGSAPASTAGGIRTTTLALCILGIIMLATGRKKARAFGRDISNDTLVNALIVFFISAAIWIFGALFIGVLLGNDFVHQIDGAGATKSPLTLIWFEVSSAFGTTGLSLGVTPLLTPMAKIILIIIMFIGQLGVSATLLVWVSNAQTDNHYDLPEEDLTIG